MKRECSVIRIGRSSALSDTLATSDWLKRYLTFCFNNDCRPDLFTFHCYHGNDRYSRRYRQLLFPLGDYAARVNPLKDGETHPVYKAIKLIK
ncbi:hypothetical protein [Paenibacillus sedimenti]|uniref:Uncharacterized protein n=1 Tax=Paenibacillus sedimenti TaxID=2770274 RepID=A0A926KMZ4_9BACL|nr:hypothetical protein [Paenibacillus sedimenti]MBD0379951.1 hypothetical protein [Paenibacillus sedimenti]